MLTVPNVAVDLSAAHGQQKNWFATGCKRYTQMKRLGCVGYILPMIPYQSTRYYNYREYGICQSKCAQTW